MLKLNVRTYGESDRPPVVLLHGLFGSSANWGMVSRQLAADHFVVVPDLRNHGQSPHTPEHGYPEMAADVLYLLDRLSIERVALVGHSMGGKVAMHLALTDGGRVERIVVADMAPVRYEHDFSAVISGFSAVDLDAIASRADADAQMRPSVAGASVRAFLLQNLTRGPEGWGWRLNLPALIAGQSRVTGFPDFPPQARYDGPACFIHGELSDYVRPSYAPVIRGLFPAARLTRIDGAGHWVYADQPEHFMQVLRDCLQRDR